MLDDTTIKEFLRDEYGAVVNAVALVCGDLAAAEDAVQEALVRAWNRSEGGEPIESLTSWVVVVALNLVRGGRRRIFAERRARERLAGSVWAPADPPGTDLVDVGSALAALPRRQREVAVLHHLLGMTTLEVAEAFGVNDGSVKNSLAKARTALAISLGADDQENDDARA